MQKSQETWVLSLGHEEFPQVGKGNLFQYYCLENSVDNRAWDGPWSCKELGTTEHACTVCVFFFRFFSIIDYYKIVAMQ